MTDKLNRLTKSSGLTINDVIKLSWKYYKSSSGDNKDKRMKIDVKSARLTLRQNYEYNQSTKQWEQNGRDVKIEFIVQSDPKSYKKTDNIKIHRYPCTFLIHDIDSGINSTFKWRTSSLKSPIFKKPGMTAQQIAEKNIRNGIQMNFFFYLEFILKTKNLLYGRCWANRPPVVMNPRGYIFFDKTSWFIVKKYLIRMLQTNGGIVKSTLIKNGKL
jgi:hypothetical protein